jgi:hypothetical protein
MVNIAIQNALRPLNATIARQNEQLARLNEAFKKYISTNSTNAQKFERLEKDLKENYASKLEFSKLQRKVNTIEFKLSVRQGLYMTNFNESFPNAEEKNKFKKLYKNLCEFAHNGRKIPSKTHEAYLRAERHLARKNAGSSGNSLETQGATQMAKNYKNLVNRLESGRAFVRKDIHTKSQTVNKRSNTKPQGGTGSATPSSRFKRSLPSGSSGTVSHNSRPQKQRKI